MAAKKKVVIRKKAPAKRATAKRGTPKRAKSRLSRAGRLAISEAAKKRWRKYRRARKAAGK